MSDPQADTQPVERPEGLEAVDNGSNFETARAYQCQLAEERDRLRLLLDINNAVVSHLDFRSLFQQIASALVTCAYSLSSSTGSRRYCLE